MSHYPSMPLKGNSCQSFPVIGVIEGSGYL
jgi:hypothetical protein